MVYTQALVFGHRMPASSEEDNLVEMLRKFVHHIKYGKHFENGGRLRKTMSSSSLGSECCMEDEFEEASLLSSLTKRIEKCLAEAKKTTLRCHQLLLPRHMIARVAGDILRAAVDEPCGIRGALINVFLDTDGKLQKLGIVTPDQSVTPTFELSVILKTQLESWPSLQHLFGSDKELRLRSEYRLIKRKLYSSASPTIHEFY
ncbi:DNA damage-inducible transcript 4-like protein [Chanos chanos]|uniref:DNA damage-inducible transcript 4-like protein n=1 Tax=Chanos chanos TaxID=29144 RepID=A0A6J2UUD9_CHACN|nr:DNA damage-inducible transcript 4-like protein [Chanos chanos]